MHGRGEDASSAPEGDAAGRNGRPRARVRPCAGDRGARRPVAVGHVPGQQRRARRHVRSTVSESAEGIATTRRRRVELPPALPPNSWFNLWFDLDNNPNTGDDGDEALVRYFDDGGIQFHRWVGNALVRRPATGMTGTYTAGTLTLTNPKAALDSVASFGVLAVGSPRGQDDGEGDERVASPPTSRRTSATSAVHGSRPAGHYRRDRRTTTLRRTSRRSTSATPGPGRIRFAITTPSHQTLPGRARGSRSASTSTGGAARAIGGVDAYVGVEGREAYAGRWSPVRGRLRGRLPGLA